MTTLLKDGELPGEFLVAESSVPRVESLLRQPEVDRLIPRGLDWRWGAEIVDRGGVPHRALYALESKAIITGTEVRGANGGSRSAAQPARGAVRAEHVRAAAVRRCHGTEHREPPRDPARWTGPGTAARDPGPDRRAGPHRNGRTAPSRRRTTSPSCCGQARSRCRSRWWSRAASVPRSAPIRSAMASAPQCSRWCSSSSSMGLYYRFAGMLATGALLLYVLFALGGLARFGFTLTLPGLAGFALSIGHGGRCQRPDLRANTRRTGRGRDGSRVGRSRVQECHERDRRFQRDHRAHGAHSLPGGHRLGPGFAITLLIGLAASMVSAVFVTRTFFMIWLEKPPEARCDPVPELRTAGAARVQRDRAPEMGVWADRGVRGARADPAPASRGEL